MISNHRDNVAIRFVLALFLSAGIAAAYLSAIGYLNPGFVA
jgi:hypothetical protein